MLKEIFELMESKKTENIVSIDVLERCAFADFFVIGQCRTSRHLITVCDALMGWAKTRGREIRVQGRNEETTWIVLDLSSVFVHLFLEDARKVFNLESLWSDASPKQYALIAQPKLNSFCSNDHSDREI